MAKIQLRRGTSAEWASANPILASGEIGFDTTLKDIKIGDGTATWSALPFKGALATSAVAGLMSAADKVTLDNLSGAGTSVGAVLYTNYVTNTLSSGNYGTNTGTGGAGSLSYQNVLANGKLGFVRYTQTTAATSGSGVNTFSGLTPKVVALGDIVTVSGFVRTNKTGVTSIQIQSRYRNGSSATPQAAETLTLFNVPANTWVPFVVTLDAATYTGDNVWVSAYFSSSGSGTYPTAGQYVDLSALMINDGPTKAPFYFDGNTPPADPIDAEIYGVSWSGTVGNSVSYLNYKSNVVDRGSKGNFYSTLPLSDESVTNKLYVDRKTNLNRIQKKEKVIIGFNRSSASYTGAQQFDEIGLTEDIMQSKSDTASWYHPIGTDTAKNYMIEVAPHLNANPDRQIMWAMENWMLNQEFIDDFNAQGPQYWNLYNALKAVIDGGNMERVNIAPFHECNGPGSTYPWQMNNATLYFLDYIATTPVYRGMDSTSVVFKGNVATSASLPTSGNVTNDAWTATDTGKLWWYKNGIFNDMGVPKRMNTPALYISAFKLIVNLARSMGFTGKFIQWFLMGNSTSSDENVVQDAVQAGYVGDDYADIIGVSYYNRYEKDAPGTWGTPGVDIRRFCYRFAMYSRNPIWTCETGCYDSDPTDSRLNKGQWYSEVVRMCGSDEIPNWQGVIMFLQTPGTDPDPAKTHDYYPENNEQLRMIGRAMNAARKEARPFSRGRHNRNLLGPAVSVPNTTAGWSGTNSVGISIVSTEPPRHLDKGTTALHMSKSTSTANVDAYAVYHSMGTFQDYEPNQPYTLSFSARASAEKFQISAGIMSQTSSTFIGEDAIQLQTVWEEYAVTFSSKTTDSAGFRLPCFKLGSNASGGWAEVTDIKLEKGSYATPNTEKVVTPRARGGYANVPSSGDWWNCESGDIWSYTAFENRTLPVPAGNPYDGQQITLRLKQDATGGRTLTHSANFKTSSVSTSIVTTAGVTNMFTYMYDASISKWVLIRNINY